MGWRLHRPRGYPLDVPPPPLPAPRAVPSAATAYLVIPFGSLLGLVLIAAVHDKLGAPLGQTWAVELWTLVKSGVVVVPVGLALAGRVREHNARVEALYAAAEPRPRRIDARTTTSSHPSLSSRGLVPLPGRDPDDEENT